MNAVLLEKQQDAIIRRRRAAVQAQGEHDDECRYADQMRAEILIRRSQRELYSSIPPSHQPCIPFVASSHSVFPTPVPEPNSMPSTDIFPGENSDKEGSDNEGSRSNSDVEDLEIKVENKRPTRSKPRESLKAAENTQQRKDGLLVVPKRSTTATVKGPAKRCKPGKKALQAAQEMSQLLDVYSPPPSSIAILNS
jgi:hypothetical protein